MTAETKNRKRGQAGFTLVELMVVIAILAILASVVGFNLLGAIGEGNQGAAKTEIKTLQGAVVMYKLHHGKFPPDLESLVNNQRQNYLDKKEIPADPWGNKYMYTVEGSNFRIVSYGGDGQPGGEGENADISSDNITK